LADLIFITEALKMLVEFRFRGGMKSRIRNAADNFSENPH